MGRSRPAARPAIRTDRSPMAGAAAGIRRRFCPEPACGKSISLNADGALRAHKTSGGSPCPGSGRRP
jgi:hypothetical protein